MCLLVVFRIVSCCFCGVCVVLWCVVFCCVLLFFVLFRISLCCVALCSVVLCCDVLWLPWCFVFMLSYYIYCAELCLFMVLVCCTVLCRDFSELEVYSEELNRREAGFA